MDFFSEQEKARRNSGRLVFLMVLAVAALIAMTVVAVAITLLVVRGVSSDSGGQTVEFGELSWQRFTALIDVPLIAGVSAVVIGIVLLGSLFKRLQLKGGGRAVAESLGGRRIPMNTQDPDERRILNVVEEMSIAAGMPVPPVYVMDDDSINAFAAGYGLKDAVIGITRGTLQQLNRAELQGVVAHEFSHIMHGDMRLNIRLVSVLHGILIIGLLGGGLLRSMHYRRLGRGRKDNSAPAILGLGLALLVIGYAGVFMGNLIKSAVSRQREFLADASAVQFTRDPATIGGALKKIGGSSYGSKLSSGHAPEFSHLFFSQAVSVGFSRLLATHPPLEERIRRVEPDWNGKYIVPSAPETGSDAATSDADADAAANLERRRDILTGAVAAGVLSPQAAQRSIDAIGQPSPGHLQSAQQLLDDLGDELRAAAHEPFSARALVYALLLSPDTVIREEQLRTLEGMALPEVFQELQTYHTRVLALPPERRLPLLELTVPALKEISPEQYRTFKQCLNALIRADGEVDLMEWTLYHILIYSLEDIPAAPGNTSLAGQQKHCAVLLSVLARAGGYDASDAQNALEAASAQLPFAVELLAEEDTPIARLTEALRALRRIKPLEKPALLKAMARCIEHNGVISAAEAELFRAVGDMLDCPMPPLMQA